MVAPLAPGLDPGPASDPLLDAEAELVALARAPAALRRALARIAGRVMATRAWERLGFARASDYARERAGVSARELRDLLLRSCVDPGDDHLVDGLDPGIGQSGSPRGLGQRAVPRLAEALLPLPCLGGKVTSPTQSG